MDELSDQILSSNTLNQSLLTTNLKLELIMSMPKHGLLFLYVLATIGTKFNISLMN